MSDSKDATQVTLLSDVPLPPYVRFLTGDDGLDQVLGSIDAPGLFSRGVVLLAAEEREAITSLLLRVACLMPEPRRLFVATQDDLPTLALRATRAGYVTRAAPTLATRDLDDVLGAIRRHGPNVVIVDAFDDLRAISDGPNRDENTIQHLRELCDACKGRALLLGVRTNKRGEIPGPESIQYAVSAVACLASRDHGIYVLSCPRKNRHGRTGHGVGYEMLDGELQRMIPWPPPALDR